MGAASTADAHGWIELTARSGALLMESGAVITNHSGDLTLLSAAGDIALSEVIGQDGVMRVEAGGAIIDATNSLTDNLVTQGELFLRAGHGMGGFEALEINVHVGVLNALNTDSDHIIVANLDSITLGSESVHNLAPNGWVVLYARSGVIGPGSVTALNHESVFLLTGLSALSEVALLAVHWGMLGSEPWAKMLTAHSTDAASGSAYQALAYMAPGSASQGIRAVIAQLLEFKEATALASLGDSWGGLVMGDVMQPFSSGFSGLYQAAAPAARAVHSASEGAPASVVAEVVTPDAGEASNTAKPSFWQTLVARLMGTQWEEEETDGETAVAEEV
jgi:hypothetical protein